MSETKWTKGPWRADWDDNGYWFIEPLGITGHALSGDSKDCIESANAHLIAAAPVLYEALAALLKLFSESETNHIDCDNSCEGKRAYNALAKARGER